MGLLMLVISLVCVTFAYLDGESLVGKVVTNEPECREIRNAINVIWRVPVTVPSLLMVSKGLFAAVFNNVMAYVYSLK